MATARARTSSTAKSPTRARKAAAKQTTAKKTTKKAAAKQTTAKKTTRQAAAEQTATPRAKQPAAKKAASKPARYPFPFVGAGLASYFEWGGLYVWFADPPPKAARAQLLKKIPEPFRHDAEWGGSVLHASSGDQFTNLHICSAYGKLGDPDDDDDHDDLEGFGVGQPFPNAAQSKAFEADINAWLHALHRKHPIAFVARREDSEAGGTKLDAWHRWSLTRFADVILPRIEEHIRKPGHKLENWAVHEVLGLAQDAPIIKLPAAVKAWLAKDR
jgi:hypothetical protein